MLANIPGPEEPVKEQLNHFLDPIVEPVLELLYIFKILQVIAACSWLQSCLWHSSLCFSLSTWWSWLAWQPASMPEVKTLTPNDHYLLFTLIAQAHKWIPDIIAWGQQFVVDAWMSMHWLSWLRHDQGKPCVAQLNVILDSAHAGDHLSNVGQPFILPSSYIGSPQRMFQICQDSYAIAAAFGTKPDLFNTATANPQWEDIQMDLLPGQIQSDHPNIEKIAKKESLIRRGPEAPIPLSSRSVASPYSCPYILDAVIHGQLVAL